MAIEKIKKRNGSVVDFDRVRIERAMEKAFGASGVAVPGESLGLMTDDVLAIVESRFVERIPGVEDIQDIVEKTLAGRGYFDVAKAYILYRREHAEIRETRRNELLERINRREITVTKRGGQSARFDRGEIEKAIINCCRLFDGPVDTDGIIRDTLLAIYDGIPTGEINQAIIMAIRARIEREPLYSRIAARFLLNDLYKEVIGIDEFEDGFVAAYRNAFLKNINMGVSVGRLDSRLLELDLDKLCGALDPERDTLLQYLGAQVLYDRYFLKDLDQKILETPQLFWMRVAMGLAI